jgi:hypothetical protein
MEKTHTKEAAEALLRDLPSVLGAYVREDVNGHPREVHLLVGPGPNVRVLAQDVRDLLQERLRVPVDQRIISIAQLTESLPEFGAEAALAETTGVAPTEPRLIYRGVEVNRGMSGVHVRVRLEWRGKLVVTDAVELDVADGRLRAAARAVIQNTNAICGERIRFELESASSLRALDQDYVLVAVLAASPEYGRKPLALVGAQPVEHEVEEAAALATLKALNRVLAKVLETV